VYTVIVQDKKVADENPVQPSEDLNPFLIFPNPEENFKVFDYWNS
jgi:glutaminyl-tRNA synthetase